MGEEDCLSALDFLNGSMPNIDELLLCCNSAAGSGQLPAFDFGSLDRFLQQQPNVLAPAVYPFRIVAFAGAYSDAIVSCLKAKAGLVDDVISLDDFDRITSRTVYGGNETTTCVSSGHLRTEHLGSKLSHAAAAGKTNAVVVVGVRSTA